jgi:hypothetical protein
MYTLQLCMLILKLYIYFLLKIEKIAEFIFNVKSGTYDDLLLKLTLTDLYSLNELGVRNVSSIYV